MSKWIENVLFVFSLFVCFVYIYTDPANFLIVAGSFGAGMIFVLWAEEHVKS